MRIAFLTSQYPATSHTFIRREIDALRAAELDIRTYSIRHPNSGECSSEEEQREIVNTWYVVPPKSDLLWAHLRGIGFHPFAYSGTFVAALRHRVPGIAALSRAILYFGEAIYLAERMRAERVGHIHNHFANPAATVGLLASRYLDLPWSLTLHGISEFDYPAGQLLPDKLRHADFVACVAHFTRAQAMRMVEPEHWSKMFINRCGVDAGKIGATGLVKSANSRVRILCVARLSPEKGLTGLLQAVHSLLERGVELELRIVGDGPERQRLLEQVETLGLGERVSLAGRVSEAEVPGELASADIFAMGSFMEGLPVVLMEALALGVACVAPRVAGIPELVEDNVTGLLFSPGNWQELAERLETLAKDAALRERLAQAGRARVAAEFDIGKAVQPIASRLSVSAARELLIPRERRGIAGTVKRLARDTLGKALAISGRSSPAARHGDNLTVVTFHRVLPDALRRQYPFPRLAVTPQELDWFLTYFARHYSCGTLAECHRRFAAGERPEKPLLAITFDDGQRDNFEYALPVLQKAGLRASFFVPTGHVTRGDAIWHDTLGFAALAAARSTSAWNAFERRLERWSLQLPAGPRPLDRLVEQAKHLSTNDRRELIEELHRAVPDAEVPPWALLMNEPQLRRVRDTGHEVGSHTINHVMLPQCAVDERRRELEESRSVLEGWLNQSVDSFCYPNGDCDDASARAVAEAGYARAVTTATGVNTAETDPTRLQRHDLDAFEVRDQLTRGLSNPLLAFRLSGWFPGM
ncbi:Glycosyltransferase involved in cell wall bisynthesis [Microbulbifer donghaiensis]|uniref:Glycosyltransferase involved in cell wall bisynthesis n=1 Tax=Microbulbifer donghaiensis TaxID=494016 RepID=A0A1M5H622_9GAMM|nr:glycosyltransferase [Microbulbifer donghaiensis]SHG11451.1 Glycosyltransferase involved in cell wall bisynthesis [Microbulbifer donghaiensis]